MKTEAFEAAYKNLNKEQKLAVDSIDGPVMVIAGPGTGKTTILTLRIANILRQTDTPPDAILALTFTESGVYAMRKKLAALIGSSAYRVQIATFHGFANEIIQRNPASFPEIIGSRPASEIDQVRILESIIKSGKWKQIKPMGDVFYYVRPALDAIRDLKKENYSPEKYKHWLKSDDTLKSADEKIKERNLELAKLFSLYEKSLRAKKLYDYEDMLIEAVRILEKDRDLLLATRENCQYILADEHQDSNGAQNKMLELLAGTDVRPNLFIVGDEKQAIYRFQGASLENFLYFRKRFPEAALVVLTESYRSHQGLLDASHSVALGLPGSVSLERPRLLNKKAPKPSAPSVSVYSFPNTEAEAASIAKKIKAARPDEQIAVLYRNNSDSVPLAEALSRAGVEFVVRSSEDVFADADIQNLITLLRTVNNPTDDEYMSKFMLADFSGLDPIDCFKIFNERRPRKIPLISALLDKKWLKAVGVEFRAFEAFAGKIKKWSIGAHNESLLDYLDRLVGESGFKDKLIASDQGLVKLAKLHAFYETAKTLVLSNPLSRLPDFVSHLDSANHFGVRLGASYAEELPYKVELMTAHRAKGLEFDTVFITGSTDDHWGGKPRRKLFDLPEEAVNTARGGEEEDERRLFYVSMTRARHRIFITHALARGDGKLLAPSRFIEDIDKGLVERQEGERLEPSFQLSARHSAGLDLKKLPPKTKSYLQKLFLEQGLTVTALNNYLDCPWQYFFRNLVRVPSAPEPHQDFGSAIHKALKLFQTEVKNGKKPMLAKLLSLFSLSLRRYGFSPNDFKLWENRGREALKLFFRHHKWSPGTEAEFNIDGIKFDFPGGVINLRGRIDEVAFDSNGSASVTDFKTGKPKSRNEILGKTKNSNGAMYRQLLFYKTLLERMRREVRADSGSIEFVEPDQSGKYRKESFPLGESDKVALELEITRVAKEIHSLEFWNKTCDKRGCKWCQMARAIRF